MSSVKAANDGQVDKKPVNFGQFLGDQVKLFPQKNLFCNPMVKEIPSIKPIEPTKTHLQPRMKLEAEKKQGSLIQINPLSSE